MSPRFKVYMWRHIVTSHHLTMSLMFKVYMWRHISSRCHSGLRFICDVTSAHDVALVWGLYVTLHQLTMSLMFMVYMWRHIVTSHQLTMSLRFKVYMWRHISSRRRSCLKFVCDVKSANDFALVGSLYVTSHQLTTSLWFEVTISYWCFREHDLRCSIQHMFGSFRIVCVCVSAVILS